MRLFVSFISVLALSASSLSAMEGMWMPSQVPELAAELKEMGLEMDPERLAELTGDPMGAIVSLGGCSASFVSPRGLIVTNHHCVTAGLQFNSTPGRNLIENGFLARTLSEELQTTPDGRVYLTSSIEDVTRKIIAGIEKIPSRERVATIERRQKELIAECEKGGGVRCLVPSFFEGSQYLKVVQTELRDVRLVYAPSRGVGNYGGEVDNWTWPRHTGDFAFLRAYVGRDGKPADYSPENVPYQPKHHLRISTGDLDPGDLAIVIGFPGTTHRYKLADKVRDYQDFTYPLSIRYRTELISILNEEGKDDEAVRIRNATRLRSLENFLKKFGGTLEAFRRSSLVETRVAEEQALTALFAKDPAAAKRHAGVMSEIARLNDATRATRERDTLLAWLYDSSPMLSQANILYRLSRERAKPDLQRESGFQDRDIARLKAGLARTQRIIEPGSDRAGLRFFLLEATRLPANQRIKAVDEALSATGETDPEAQVDAFLDRLYSNTRIGDLAAREEMFQESTQKLVARKDSMIDFAADLRQLGDANAERDRATKGIMAVLRPQYVEALRQLRGGTLYPDANGSLRVSFGVVEGYSPRDSVQFAAQTTLAGLVEKYSGVEPFDAPPALVNAQKSGRFGPYVDPDLGDIPVNFLSSGDITNGSSGSATLNARGDLIGLAFDGNIEAMGMDFLVNPRIQRTIHVDSRFMIWVMDAVDGAHHLLEEMGLPSAFRPAM